MKVILSALISTILLIAIGMIPARTINISASHEKAPVKESVQEKPTTSIQAVITSYSSSVDETDDTPFITASNQKVRKGIVANNCLEFGSEVVINGEKYEVQDRMNRRYGCERFDIWHESKELALKWGIKELEIIILE